MTSIVILERSSYADVFSWYECLWRSENGECPGDGVTCYNIYCDESCHLEHDGQKCMVLGAIWCPTDRSRQISEDIRAIKMHFGLLPTFEIKWSKVSNGKLPFYMALVDYFFDSADIRFRALVVPDKTQLDHAAFQQTHDTFYYKVYFDMLKTLLDPASAYYIYIDIKDSRSHEKTTKLGEVLSNNIYDFKRNIIRRLQTIRSHESEPMQLADLLIGAVGYVNRGLASNEAKVALFRRVRARSSYALTQSTLLAEKKMNIFIWRAAQGEQ